MPNIISDFYKYIKVKKKYWLIPIIIMLVVIGALIVFGQSSALSPFVYALF